MACSAVNGGQIAISAGDADTRGSSPWMWALASATVLCIFQFPTINGLRAKSVRHTSPVTRKSAVAEHDGEDTID